jgi:hypothetical protein
MLLLLIQGNFKHAVELGQGSMGSMTYIPSLVKNSVGVQEILRFCLKNLCNVGITDARDFFLSTPLRWAFVP